MVIMKWIRVFKTQPDGKIREVSGKMMPMEWKEIKKILKKENGGILPKWASARYGHGEGYE